MLQPVRHRVVGVADLANLEPGAQVLRQVLVVARLDLRLHLQALDRLQPGDVLGGEGLVARAEQELLVEPGAEHRRHGQAQGHDDPDERHRDQGQHHAVIEHDGHEHQQEGQVEDQRHGRTRHEFADGLHPAQACRDDPCGPVLEVARGQFEQMLEHGRSQHRVDPVAGVQHQVLAYPGEQHGEHHEHGQADADHDERALGVVHHDLVDHHLGEQRCCQGQQLDHEGCDQHVAPDVPVFQEFRDEPAKAEAPGCRRHGIRIGERFGAGAELQHLARELGIEVGARDLAGCGICWAEQHDAGGVYGDEEGQSCVRLSLRRVRRGRRRRRKHQTRQRQCGELAGFTGAHTRPKAHRACRLQEGCPRIRRRKALQQQARIEGDAMHLAHRPQGPHEVGPLQCP